MQEVFLGDSGLIYQVGARADAIFSIISGFVILRRPDPGGGGREQLMGPSAVFGGAVVLAHLPELVLSTMIDRKDGLFVICDHRSFHGAVVNSIALTASGGGLKSPLDQGENELIAGDAESPFRFTYIISS